jgi:hypothetical protein
VWNVGDLVGLAEVGFKVGAFVGFCVVLVGVVVGDSVMPG